MAIWELGVAEYYPVDTQIPLKSPFEGKFTPVFNITLEFLHEQSKILLKKFCFAHAKIPL